MIDQKRAKDSHPAISIIMPSLNVALFIRQSVESVMNQTFSDIEILCIDAGSTDGTKEILMELSQKDSRIRVIQSERKSYGYQMNMGLDMAQGKYIGIVETDDFIDRDMYEELYATARNENLDVVKSNFWLHSNNEDTFFEHLAGLPYRKTVSSDDIPSIFIRKEAIWAGLYRRAFLIENDIRFLETPGASFQDVSYMLKVWICAKKICFIKPAFLHYRTDNPNSSVKSKEKIFFVRDEMLAVHDFLNRFPDKKERYQKLIWDREALVYEWNVKRLPDELKYEFLLVIQNRFQAGIEYGHYERRYLPWSTWKMIHEVAEDPLIYLKGRCCEEYFREIVKSLGASKDRERKFRKWSIKEKMLLIPQLMIDVQNFTKQFGITYCIKKCTNKIK